MTELLQRVIARVEQLSAADQDAIAEAIARKIEEREWDALVSSPGSQRFLEHLAADAREEDAAGKTHEATDRW